MVRLLSHRRPDLACHKTTAQRAEALPALVAEALEQEVALHGSAAIEARPGQARYSYEHLIGTFAANCSRMTKYLTIRTRILQYG